MYGTFREAVSVEKGLRLYSDATRSVSLTYGGSRTESVSRNVTQPLVVPPNTSNVVLPYMPNQLLLKSGYFSMRCGYFRLFYPDWEANTSKYVSLTVEFYIGTKTVADVYLFRSSTTCMKGSGAEVFVPDIHDVYVGVGKNVFCHFYTGYSSGSTVEYALEFRYCATFDD